MSISCLGINKRDRCPVASKKISHAWVEKCLNALKLWIVVVQVRFFFWSGAGCPWSLKFHTQLVLQEDTCVQQYFCWHQTHWSLSWCRFFCPRQWQQNNADWWPEHSNRRGEKIEFTPCRCKFTFYFRLRKGKHMQKTCTKFLAVSSVVQPEENCSKLKLNELDRYMTRTWICFLRDFLLLWMNKLQRCTPLVSCLDNPLVTWSGYLGFRNTSFCIMRGIFRNNLSGSSKMPNVKDKSRKLASMSTLTERKRCIFLVLIVMAHWKQFL